MTARPQVRAMRREDLPAVLAIDACSFPIPWSENAFRAELANVAGHYVVVEVGGQVAGYAGAWIVADEVHITTLGVDPRRRRQGLGEQLLGAVLREACGRGARRASLEVRASNVAARRLYEKFGFTAVSRRFGYYSDNGEDAIVMWIDDMGRSPYRELLAARFAALEATGARARC